MYGEWNEAKEVEKKTNYEQIERQKNIKKMKLIHFLSVIIALSFAWWSKRSKIQEKSHPRSNKIDTEVVIESPHLMFVFIFLICYRKPFRLQRIVDPLNDEWCCLELNGSDFQNMVIEKHVIRHNEWNPINDKNSDNNEFHKKRTHLLRKKSVAPLPSIVN